MPKIWDWWGTLEANENDGHKNCITCKNWKAIVWEASGFAAELLTQSSIPKT
jgi:hypothetical protein